MYIDEKKKFIFFSVPKVCSSSIFIQIDPNAHQVIQDRFIKVKGSSLEGMHNFKYKKIWTSIFHITYSELLILLPEFPVNTFFKIAFVRNPYTRIYSAFRQYISEMHTGDPIDFNSFLQNIDAYKINHTYHFIHFKPINKYILHNEKTIIDFIGRFENLDQD